MKAYWFSFVLVAAIAAVAPLIAAGENPHPRIRIAREKYDTAVAKAKRDYDDAVVKAKREYSKDLDSALGKAMEAKDLDGANAVRAEREGVENDSPTKSAIAPARISVTTLTSAKWVRARGDGAGNTVFQFKEDGSIQSVAGEKSRWHAWKMVDGGILINGRAIYKIELDQVLRAANDAAEKYMMVKAE